MRVCGRGPEDRRVTGELEQARAELAAARERIAGLEARLRQSPRNSSKPRSSGGLGKPPRKRWLRKKSGRKPGQHGHERKTPAQVARPEPMRVCGQWSAAPVRWLRAAI
ncbi:MAG: DUF6444 domain-containing protein [Streptosporangiaceae bacterium]